MPAASPDSALLVATDLTKRYGDAVVLRSASLCVQGAESLAVVGPSGSGKSTLLHILGALDTPSSGSVRVGDTVATDLRGDELAGFRAARVGFVFQEHYLLPQLTALENVLLPTLVTRADGQTDRARELLDRVGVSHRAGAFPPEMSGGERQRVAVARALVNRPQVLLCDEPTGSLDRESGAAVLALLLEAAHERGAALVIVTHNPEHACRCSHQATLIDGVLEPLA